MINLDTLNKQQKEAVLASDKYIRIIAGAGSGKTRVLTTRIAYLILEKEVYQNKILAITFTNKAANEMKARIKKMLNDNNTGSWICHKNVSFDTQFPQTPPGGWRKENHRPSS